jgi:hypothetical protein
MAQFVWIDWNEAKLAMHHLSTREVEHAWEHRTDVTSWGEPEPGTESYGRAPNGRWVKIIWRYNGIGDEDLIFVITAYHSAPPTAVAERR